MIRTIELAVACFLLQGTAGATFYAQYNFDDLTANDSSGNGFHLSAIGATPDFTGGAYHSDGSSSNYLHVDGPGELADFTVSVWVNSDAPKDQGDYIGIFSSNLPTPIGDSFQFDSTNGKYSFTKSVVHGSAPVQVGVWQNLILQKVGGNSANFYVDGNLVNAFGGDPGELFDFALGINRFISVSFKGLIDNLQIWDDSDQSASAIFDAGVNGSVVPVPEPASIAMWGMGAIGLIVFHRRKRTQAA